MAEKRKSFSYSYFVTLENLKFFSEKYIYRKKREINLNLKVKFT